MTRDEKVAAVEACWPKWPTMYDALTDEHRDVTQQDVDTLIMIRDKFFVYLRRMDADRIEVAEFAQRRRADNQ